MVNRFDPKVAEAVMLKAGLKPLEPYKSSSSKWKCECLKCGNLCFPAWDSIRRGQGGCKKCAYEKVGNGRRGNSDDAVAFMNVNNLEPLEPFKSVKTAWKSKCLKCGHIVAPRMRSIQNGQGACEYCAGTKIDPEEAVTIMLANKLKPLESFKKSRLKWKCECLRCGDIVYPYFNSIKNGQGGCWKCGQVERAEANTHSHEYTSNIMLKAGLEPLEPYSHSERKWKSKCLKCGNIINPTFHNVSSAGSGCPYCAEIGFRLDKPAYFYIIIHNDMDSIKVGIGNHDRKLDRVESFLKNGWQLFKKFEFKSGNDASIVELEILRWLRKDKGLPPHLTLDQMPKTGGHTETVSADSITVLEIQKKVKQVIKGLQE